MKLLGPALLAAALTGAAAAQTAPPHTVEGLTITGKGAASKPCGNRDDTCIATVIAKLKARYPKQLETWCNQVKMRAAMNTMMFSEIDIDRPHPNVGPYTAPAVSRVACAPTAKP